MCVRPAAAEIARQALDDGAIDLWTQSSGTDPNALGITARAEALDREPEAALAQNAVA